MIESAAQILLSVSNANKNNADKSAMFRRNDRTPVSSFGEVYDKSTAQSENRQSLNARENASSDQTSENNTPTVANSNRREGKPKAESEKAGGGQSTENDLDKTNSAQAGVKENPVGENENDNTAVIDASPANTEPGVADEEYGTGLENAALLTPLLEETEAVAEQVVSANINDSENITLAKQTSGQLALAIVSELQASKEKLTTLDGIEKASRSKVLSDIEKVLLASAEKGKQTSTEKVAIAQQSLTEESLTASEKTVKPEIPVNLNAVKALGEKLSSRDINSVVLGTDSRPVVDGEEVASALQKPTDVLLEKMLQRLDLSKLKGEENQLAKIAADKSSIAEFVDQMSAKINSDSSIATLLSASNTLNTKSAAVALPTQLVMNTPINQPQWGADLSKRIQFMINNDIKNAELRLDPPELGRINIKLSLNQDQLNVAFSSAHSNVREVIENTLPRLREMLQDSGIQLGDANVNERQKGEEQQASSDANLTGPVFPGFDDEADVDSDSRPIIQHAVDGVIDYFA